MAATLAGAGLSLGAAAGSTAEASRFDAFASSAFHFPLGEGEAKAGVSFHAAQHTLSQAFAGDGDLLFSDFAAIAAGTGVFTDGASVQSSFSLPRLGAFAQYALRPAPGVQVLVGGRFDYETIPGSDVRANDEWLEASGVANDSFPSSFNLPSGVFSVTWDATGSGETVLFAGASSSRGSLDPRVMHEALANDGTSSVRRALGDGLGWPSPDAPASARREEILTLLGPDIRPPRTSTLEGGLNQQLGGGWTLHASGTLRETEFLPRRRDLNLPLYPLAADAHGREILGDLRKLGAAVSPAVASNRRFDGFDAVWALDPDGWSRYWGVTLGLGYSDERSDVWAAYTRSETRDNWVGAAIGLADAELDPRLPGEEGRTWSEGISDFDAPHRLVLGARARFELGGGSGVVSAMYSRRSGRPFTPRYRVGVDANGDGSFRNDVAFVPAAGDLAELLDAWPCLADQAGAFAVRNSCRGPDRSGGVDLQEIHGAGVVTGGRSQGCDREQEGEGTSAARHGFTLRSGSRPGGSGPAWRGTRPPRSPGSP
ncbi:MAG: hypothetical protein FIA95_12340 [Gemmatimonadetes bacterium]|nr:hypothetical protein [Gemmatimonadota bacterium]